MTITEFLLARIAEDEAVARELLTHQPEGPWMDTLEDLTYEHDHFANWNPDRVLDECAAKRAIIGRIPKLSDEYRPDWFTGKSALYILATVYSDHPDYQQEWAL